MKPTTSVVIHIVNEYHIKVDLAVRLSPDTWDELFKIPKSVHAGISLQHPEKGSKLTWFGFEVKFNACWNYKVIAMKIFDVLKVVKEVETIRLNNKVDNNDSISDCRPFTIKVDKHDSISD